MEEGLIQTIRALYENSSSAVVLNSQLGEVFRAIVYVRQGCLLSVILFSLFPEKIMQETLHDHHTFIFLGGRPICNLSFANDIDLMGGSNGGLQDLTNRLVHRARAYGMKGSTEKVMTKSMHNTSTDISIISQKLEEMTI